MHGSKPARRAKRVGGRSFANLSASPALPSPPDPKKVFTSSTQKDLDPYRAEAARVITRIDWHPIQPSENGTIHAGPMLRRCFEEIGRSNLFVLIVGYRYGWIPRAEDGGQADRSITRMEYELWKARQQFCGVWPAIVFMASNDDRFLSENETEELRARQVIFRTELRRETTVHPFTYLPQSATGHSDSVQEFGRTVREQLVQAKDRMAERTRMTALRVQAESQRRVKEMQDHIASLQQQLQTAQTELAHIRAHEPANTLALLAVGGVIGAGLSKT